MNITDINNLPKTRQAANKRFLKGDINKCNKRPTYIDLHGLEPSILKAVKSTCKNPHLIEDVQNFVYSKIINNIQNMHGLLDSFTFGFYEIYDVAYSLDVYGRRYAIRVNDRIVYYFIDITYIKIKYKKTDESEYKPIFQYGAKKEEDYYVQPLIDIDLTA